MSNHVEFKHHEKKNRVHPHDKTIGMDEEEDLDKENDNKETETDSREKAKSRKGIASAIRKVSSVNIMWKRYFAKGVHGKKGESQARDGPAHQGSGLGDLDENFTPSDLTPAQRRQVVEATWKLHDYFKTLGKQRSEEENSQRIRVNFDLIEHDFGSGARIDWPDQTGQTIIHEAVRAWSVDVVMYLLDKAGNPKILDTPDKFGRTPLHVAAIVNNVRVAKFLLDNGANKEARTNEELQTPAHYAAKYDSYDVMKTLIKAECEYKEVADYKGRTPLQLAAENGVSHMVSLMLELNAPVNVHDDQGQLAIVLIMKNTRSLARDAMDQFIKRDSIRRQQTVNVNYMVPKPIEKTENPSFAQSPLEVITTNMFYDLVTHDIIKAIISIKWKHFGKCGAVGNLILHLLFIVVWTVLGVYPDWTIRYKYNFPHDAWRVCLWVVAVTLTVYEIVCEIIEYKKSKSKLNNWKKWKKTQLSRDMNFCHPQWPMEEKFLKKKLCSIDREKMVYLKDCWWNVLDWICYIFLTTCILTHLTDVLLPVHSVTLARAHIRIMVVTLILVWLRLMKYARAFAALGPFIVILGQMIDDFAKFFFLYFVFYVPYLAGFWMIFGGVKIKDKYVESPPTGNTTFVATTQVLQGFDNLHKLLFSLFRLTLVDDYPYEEMNEVDPIMSDLLVATWFALTTIICINLFIALLADTFQRVYDNAQANGLMLKAITIMEIEGSLPKKQLKKHIDFIHQDVEPEDYVEDVSKGESDLKKVAFQVKQELEEMREWFTEKFGPVQHAPDLSGTFTPQDLRTSMQRRGSTQQNEMSHLRGEILGIKQDMASLKGLLQELMGIQQRGGGGEWGRGQDGNDGGVPNDVPATGISSGVPAGRDVLDGEDDDNTIPYTKRSLSLIPLYDEDEYDTMRDMEKRHVSRRRKKKQKRSRHPDDVEDPRALTIPRTSPTVEVDSFGFMEPPPQQIVQLQPTPEPEIPDSTDA
ncbi:uncharacterized protein LOC135486578 isoform X2 [Lineus longissimus]|uniref:uncharacterized protein LOC135486578 isoform X2 n=1 Tax=Lineus longissimus TaxID=88925 RepID=UPI00315DD7D1